MSSGAWLSPPQHEALSLPASEVHIWQASLDLEILELEALRQLLSPDEQVRASRFHFEKDRRRFIASHGILRKILSRYLGGEPAGLEFCFNRFGKPFLGPPCSRCDTFFSLSHSDDLALYAVSRCPNIGIDVERVKKDFPFEQIVEDYFSPYEIEALRSLPEEQKCLAFFSGWTRKEAFVKAHGKGLSLSISSFSVSLTSGEETVMFRDDEFRNNSLRILGGMIPSKGYVAALATRDPNLQVKQWQWAEKRRPL